MMCNINDIHWALGYLTPLEFEQQWRLERRLGPGYTMDLSEDTKLPTTQGPRGSVTRCRLIFRLAPMR